MEIWNWFVGFEKAHGQYELKGKSDERGKAQGRAVTVAGPATEQMWKAHLKGEGAPGIGIIPLLADDNVRWGCIDIDQYQNFNLADLAKELKHTPLVVFRSKSGGAHVVLFLSEPVPAADVQSYLTSVAASIGHAGCEIFPKQSSRASDRDIGNWLNMPYYDARATQRYAIDSAGKPLKYRAAMDLIEAKALDAERFYTNEPTPEVGADLFKDGPPCLMTLAQKGGFPEGTRNEGMYNVAVYLRKAYPDDWQQRMVAYSDQMCDPPLGLKELQTIEKSITKKDYHYRCKQAPISAVCNRRVCLTRKFGVGRTATPDIDSLTKYEGEPVLWVVEISGKRVELMTEELMSQPRFAQRCADVLTRLPMPMPPPRWVQYVDELMQECDIVAAPSDEETQSGQFAVILERFCIQRAQATHVDQLIDNFPWTSEGRTYFRGDALLVYLKRCGFAYRHNRVIWGFVRDIGGEKHLLTIRTGEIQVWSVPAFEIPTPSEAPAATTHEAADF